MKIIVNGSVIKETPDAPQPQTRGLMAEDAAPITPQDINNVVNLAFTLVDVVKVLWAVIKGWFKKS